MMASSDDSTIAASRAWCARRMASSAVGVAPPTTCCVSEAEWNDISLILKRHDHDKPARASWAVGIGLQPLSSRFLVPGAGLEPACLAAGDFKSPVSDQFHHPGAPPVSVKPGTSGKPPCPA